MSEERAHDASYRKLFSHPLIIKLLLRDFVGEQITGALDFDHMEALKTSFIAESMVRREADMLWKIPRKRGMSGEPLHLYLLLEFQSSIDPLMAIRILEYVAFIYRHIATQQAGGLKPKSLPPVLPVVLYNGSAVWSAAQQINELIDAEPGSPLSAYIPALQFYLVDEGRLDPARLTSQPSLLAELFAMEAIDDPDKLAPPILRISQLLRENMAEELRRDIILWINEMLRPHHITLTPQQLLSFTEKQPMFHETMTRWRDQLLKEGQEEGREEGREEARVRTKREMLVKLMQLKFGEDEAHAALVEVIDEPQLDLALERILSAQDAAALFAPELP